MHTLGMLYRDGDGVQANLTTSYEWLSLAVRLYGPGQPQRSEAARQAMLANATQLPAKARAEADQWIAQWKPREHVRPEEQAPPRRSFGPPPRADSI